MSNGPHKALTEFRNCWEASMTFEEALGCAGLADKSDALIEVLQRSWNGWERSLRDWSFSDALKR